MAYNSLANVIGYGGAAGGGKTDFILGKALTQHQKAIIFRRESTQFSGIIERGEEIFNGLATFNQVHKVWKFDEVGRFIELGYVQFDKDKRKYRGRPHDLIAIDEATEWNELLVRFLMGWNRTAKIGQRCQTVLTFNPPDTKEGEWVLSYFAPWLDPNHPNPAVPGELRWYATIPDPEARDGYRDIERPDGEPFRNGAETVTPLSRTFVPAKVTDNPVYMATNYVQQLQGMPEPLRSQLLYGDFVAGLKEDAWQLIPSRWIELSNDRWLARNASEMRRTPMTAVGNDVAHGGKDKTTIARRHDHWFDELLSYPGKETPTGNAAATLVVDAWLPPAHINVDAIGYGAACAEKLQEHNIDAYAVNVAMPSEFRDRSTKFGMINQRAEMFWRIREALDPEYPDSLIDLPPDPELRADLTSLSYEITPRGIKIRSKSEIRGELARSTDKGDAVGLAMLPEPARSAGFSAGGEKTPIVAPYVGGRR